jgi:predicted nucleic acid-binding protein
MKRVRSLVPDSPEEIIIDASVIVDLLAETSLADAAHAALDDRRLTAPAHIDAEVLSALGRMQRAGLLTDARAMEAVRMCAAMPVERAPLPGLLAGAWNRRSSLRLSDALYVELAESTERRLVTSDHRLGREYSGAEVLTLDA